MFGQLDSELHSTILSKKLKSKSKLLKNWFRSGHDRGLTFDLLMKNRALLLERMSTGENMVEEVILGRIRNQWCSVQGVK